MNDQRPTGSIEVITGSMYAGKTEELIRRLHRLDYAKKPYQLFKPAIDDRYSQENVVSHNGQQLPSIPIQTPKEILGCLDVDTQIVAIDEVQFFDDSIVAVIDHLANDGYRVIAAGLDKDFRCEPFGPMPALLTKAEKVTKLTAICNVCGADATCTQRLVNGEPASYHDPIVQVGAQEAYEPRCRACHIVKDVPDLLA